LAHSRNYDGHDASWLIGEPVPILAAMFEDVLEACKDPVRQPIVAHELPDILDPLGDSKAPWLRESRIGFWAFGWQWDEGDDRRHDELFLTCAIRLIE
jgi:hypothetical protein